MSDNILLFNKNKQYESYLSQLQDHQLIIEITEAQRKIEDKKNYNLDKIYSLVNELDKRIPNEHYSIQKLIDEMKFKIISLLQQNNLPPKGV